MAAEKGLDPLGFLRVFTSFLEAARRCLTIIYLYHGEERVLSGRVYVYRGLVQYGSRYLESGEHGDVHGPVRAVEESILILDECAGSAGGAFADCVLSDMLSRPPVVVGPDVSIREAVKLMWSSGVSSVVVVEGGRPIGILTDADVKNFVANEVDLSRPVREVAVKPLTTSGKWESCMDALIKMAVNNIKHLVVVDSSGSLVGVVTTRDIAYRLLPVPIHFLKDLRNVWEEEKLRRVREDLETWAKRRSQQMLEPGGPGAIHLTKLVTEINDIIMSKVVGNVLALLGPPPCPFAVAASGSQGVYEQFVVTDMDNFIVAACEDEYFNKLGKEVVERLMKIGYPPCREGYSMDRLVLHLPRVESFIESAGDKDVILASLIFDGRVLYGSRELVGKAREAACRWGRYNRLRVLSSALRYKPPLGMFDRLEKRFKVKENLLAPLTLPIKALSMVHCVVSYAIYDRIGELANIGVISRALAEELKASYETLLRYVIWAKGQGKAELTVDEVPNISMLKAAFRPVKTLHEFLEKSL
ncbi:putative signal-transduction protein containing cAMP-binding and CBS domains [Pyrobaculum oguniense TE7]|uniref:Signal-transduction protein containing cAMP-binding and CBS domains n=1 Tax=Pyrobaculum oguniense (strain DSM 13380 / JCM 10595 / TE7) TaxID=698757 RepID=H6QAG0_PYROT|nr:putative signal-transduction protein containing cAMP-binding and CBS domains [Pyrobaculum oguniense TE7]